MTNSKGEIMAVLPPLKSWQFYEACRHNLGIETLTSLFSRSKTQIYRWGRDPRACVDVEHNPIDRMQFLLERLCEVGREEIARAAVAMMAQTVGCRLQPDELAVPDQDTLEGECLDDYPALVDFHRAVREGKHRDEVRFRYQEALRELNETWTLYQGQL